MTRRALALRQFCAAGLALFALLFIVAKCTGCEAPKSATYGGELAACTASAKARLEQGAVSQAEACQESIRCENAVRARYDRAPRRFSLDCK
jgi:hypothetical protein